MAGEISISAIVIEMDDGSYSSICPDIGIEAKGVSADDALANLKDAVVGHIRKLGTGSVNLRAVKCMKIKVSVD